MQWLHLRNTLLYLKITKTLFVGFVKNLAIRCFVGNSRLNSGFNNFNGSEIKLHPMNTISGNDLYKIEEITWIIKSQIKLMKNE